MSAHRTVNILARACHPERSEESHTGCGMHTNVRGVINYPMGGPSVAAATSG